MKAIVLSFDKQIGFAELLHKRYMALWPSCPFRFLVPYNDPKTLSDNRYLGEQENVELRRSPIDIPSTMDTLLDGCEDDEWVYWCIDDRYPHSVHDIGTLDAVHQAILDGALNDSPAVKLTRWLEKLSDDQRTINGTNFYRQKNSKMWGFWHHHYLRARHLRKIFDSTRFNAIWSISEINLFSHLVCPIEDFNGALVPEHNIIDLAEPCMAGKLTAIGARDMAAYGCKPPNYSMTDIEMVFDDARRRRKIRRTKKKAAERKQKPKIAEQVEPGPPFYVVSYGGVGSKWLLKGLLPGQSIPFLHQHHKHWRRPRHKLAPETPLVYVFGDPRNAVISFFNRRVTLHSRHDFTGIARPGVENWPHQHCVNLKGDSADFSTDWDLAAFLENGPDLFRLEEHFENWLTAKRPRKVLFVRYESLRSHASSVLEFLDLPIDLADSFPPHTPRIADWHQASASVQQGLERLYGPFARRLEELPDVFTR